jgi:hypothetical protein
MKGSAPIKGITMKEAKNNTLDDLKSKSFLSHKAFKRKPQPRKATQAMKSETTVWVSSKYNPTPIGRMVSNPAICSRNPEIGINTTAHLSLYALGFE